MQEKIKNIYDRLIRYGLPEHKFGDYKCVFITGFKFEIDNSLDEPIYVAYNTRKNIYRKLSESEIDYIVNNDIFQASARSSYIYYRKLYDKYNGILNNKKSSKKSTDKAQKVADEYFDRCKQILLKYPKLLGEFAF